MKKTDLKKFMKVFLTIALSTLILCSCGSKTDNGMTESMDNMSYEAPMEQYPDYDFAMGGAGDLGFKTDYSYVAEEEFEAESSASDVTVTADSVTETSRKIIYSSAYDIETKEFDKSVGILEGLCKKYGAYMESANTYTAGGSAKMAYYTIRVPVERYNDFTSEAGTIGVVISSSQDNKDVTESYYDTEARLESAKIREERVLEILKNSSDLDDVLALERELADIRYEIESYTGTLRKYDSLISYATVDITIQEVQEYVEPKPVTVTFGERMSSSFDDGINEFKEGWQDLLVGLSYNFIPLVIWLIIIVILIIVLRIIIKKVKKKLKEWDKNDHASAFGEGTAKAAEDPSETKKEDK